MRVFFALLLTHYFHFVILLSINNELTFNRLNDIKYNKKCIPKTYKNINFCYKDDYTTQKYVHSLINQTIFVNKSKMYPLKLQSKHVYTLEKCINSFDKYHQRKLLIYEEKDISEYLSTSKNDWKINEITTSQYFHLRQRKQNDFENDEETTNEEYSDDWDDWDDWGAWGPCSVTCGCGQQVRWRHCITDDCIKGLKRAQIKTCHLKPCDKGFLSWLGIKLK
ncbi:PREDICTED: uncharacterized protein LOC107065850 [Polistes dominula]|uniref:Uncharacterized protein LOC107065850 n=1 Tax=Polistes dominula TaxID=743375 RepID=A0ABM1I599_POLDO|nr:PREDICTED: uncharacterized protein LOC107065850 [Polistes dominula]